MIYAGDTWDLFDVAFYKVINNSYHLTSFTDQYLVFLYIEINYINSLHIPSQAFGLVRITKN